MGLTLKAVICFLLLGSAAHATSKLPSACRVVAIPEFENSLDHLSLQPGLAEQVQWVRQEIAWYLATDPDPRVTLKNMEDSSYPLWERVRKNLETSHGMKPALWIRLFAQVRIELGIEGFPEERDFLAGAAMAPLYYKAEGDEILVRGRTLLGAETAARELLNLKLALAGNTHRIKSLTLLPREFPTFAPEEQIFEARLEKVPRP